ncbi:hypothetical protein Vadar_004350 [Vaccinium darrowii]|uniref:Uncharacterized protein n=1 Tax=Vaccinium darrowii TaxID=229202 RepID=A0ACB7YBT5_9ERIC|nr:hypothetical protein Vadar_004350 [Vaccinium darrowii]
MSWIKAAMMNGGHVCSIGHERGGSHLLSIAIAVGDKLKGLPIIWAAITTGSDELLETELVKDSGLEFSSQVQREDDFAKFIKSQVKETEELVSEREKLVKTYEDNRKTTLRRFSRRSGRRCCDGRECKKSFHLSCLDPPFTHAAPGVWHCNWCIQKKLQSGVHAVSEGVESIVEASEVELDH